MTPHLCQWLGEDVGRVIRLAERHKVVASALQHLLASGVVGRIRLIDSSRPIFLQVDGVGEDGTPINPMLLSALNEEAGELVRRWCSEPDRPTTNIYGNFFPKTVK